MNERLSPVMEDYLKTIWSLAEWSSQAVTITTLAGRLDLSPAAVSEAIGRLSTRGLVAHRPYGAVTLTDEGLVAAANVVRRHRLLETLLCEVFGFGWDEVHVEADALEHAVSALLIDRIDAHLGHPVRDPHGDPIPRLENSYFDEGATRLSDLRAGERGKVLRVHDRDSGLLRYLSEAGVAVGSVIEVRARNESADIIEFVLEAGGSVVVSSLAARSMLVTRA